MHLPWEYSSLHRFCAQYSLFMKPVKNIYSHDISDSFKKGSNSRALGDRLFTTYSERFPLYLDWLKLLPFLKNLVFKCMQICMNVTHIILICCFVCSPHLAVHQFSWTVVVKKSVLLTRWPPCPSRRYTTGWDPSWHCHSLI